MHSDEVVITSQNVLNKNSHFKKKKSLPLKIKMEANYLYAACHHALSHTQQDINKDICGAKSYPPVTRAEDA